MPDKKTPAVDTHPAIEPANCTGELVLSIENPVYNYYNCQTCHAVVPVSREYLAEHGLPPEHSPAIL